MSLSRTEALFQEDIEKYIEKIKTVLSDLNIMEIDNVIQKIIEVYNREGKVYVCGNGGSASTASHFVNDFNKGLSEHLIKKFKFYCLNDNVSSLMAIANDNCFEEVFAEQLKNYLDEGDMVIGISGSGNSKNVVNAIEYANERGIDTVGLIGFDGGILKKVTSHTIHVNTHDMQKVEDVHLMIIHLMMITLKNKLECNSQNSFDSDIDGDSPYDY